MSFEILEAPVQTMFAPLNTTIDADRDYYDLTGLDACACQGGAARTQMQLAGEGLPVLEGFYQENVLTPGMLGAIEGDNRMVWVLGAILAAWAWWAWRTPYQAAR